MKRTAINALLVFAAFMGIAAAYDYRLGTIETVYQEEIHLTINERK